MQKESNLDNELDDEAQCLKDENQQNDQASKQIQNGSKTNGHSASQDLKKKANPYSFKHKKQYFKLKGDENESGNDSGCTPAKAIISIIVIVFFMAFLYLFLLYAVHSRYQIFFQPQDNNPVVDKVGQEFTKKVLEHYDWKKKLEDESTNNQIKSKINQNNNIQAISNIMSDENTQLIVQELEKQEQKSEQELKNKILPEVITNLKKAEEEIQHSEKLELQEDLNLIHNQFMKDNQTQSQIDQQPITQQINQLQPSNPVSQQEPLNQYSSSDNNNKIVMPDDISIKQDIQSISKLLLEDLKPIDNDGQTPQSNTPSSEDNNNYNQLTQMLMDKQKNVLPFSSNQQKELYQDQQLIDSLINVPDLPSTDQPIIIEKNTYKNLFQAEIPQFENLANQLLKSQQDTTDDEYFKNESNQQQKLEESEVEQSEKKTEVDVNQEPPQQQNQQEQLDEQKEQPQQSKPQADSPEISVDNQQNQENNQNAFEEKIKDLQDIDLLLKGYDKKEVEQEVKEEAIKQQAQIVSEESGANPEPQQNLDLSPVQIQQEIVENKVEQMSQDIVNMNGIIQNLENYNKSVVEQVNQIKAIHEAKELLVKDSLNYNDTDASKFSLIHNNLNISNETIILDTNISNNDENSKVQQQSVESGIDKLDQLSELSKKKLLNAINYQMEDQQIKNPIDFGTIHMHMDNKSEEQNATSQTIEPNDKWHDQVPPSLQPIPVNSDQIKQINTIDNVDKSQEQPQQQNEDILQKIKEFKAQQSNISIQNPQISNEEKFKQQFKASTHDVNSLNKLNIGDLFKQKIMGNIKNQTNSKNELIDKITNSVNDDKNTSIDISSKQIENQLSTVIPPTAQQFNDIPQLAPLNKDTNIPISQKSQQELTNLQQQQQQQQQATLPPITSTEEINPQQSEQIPQRNTQQMQTVNQQQTINQQSDQNQQQIEDPQQTSVQKIQNEQQSQQQQQLQIKVNQNQNQNINQPQPLSQIIKQQNEEQNNDQQYQEIKQEEVINEQSEQPKQNSYQGIEQNVEQQQFTNQIVDEQQSFNENEQNSKKVTNQSIADQIQQENSYSQDADDQLDQDEIMNQQLKKQSLEDLNKQESQTLLKQVSPDDQFNQMLHKQFPCDNNFQNQDSSCIVGCPPGTFENLENRQCDRCSPECQSCDQNENMCTSCSKDLFLINSMCLEQCPDGYIANKADRFCEKRSQADANLIDNNEFLSVLLQRPIKFSVFLPDQYNNGLKRAYSIVYLLHGLSQTYNTWTNILDMQKLAEEIQVIFVAVQTGDRWLVNSKVTKNSKMESMFLNELTLFIEKKYRIQQKDGKPSRILLGIDAGGHAALRLYLSQRNMFELAIALSPILDPSVLYRKSSQSIAQSANIDIYNIPFILGNRQMSEDYSINKIAEKLLKDNDEELHIVLITGERDPFLEQCQEFQQTLKKKHNNIVYIEKVGNSHENQFIKQSLKQEIQEYLNQYQNLQERKIFFKQNN